MSQSRIPLSLIAIIGAIGLLIATTMPYMVSKMRFGLEFRGGYEIYYVVNPLPGKDKVTPEDLVETAHILGSRADSIGMAEPEIHIEGDNHIRLKLAGLTSANESRSHLGDPAGLPTVLIEKYTQTVGSVLGKTALKDTMMAGAIGIGCIFLLLAILYRGVGLLAAFATLVYLWLLVLVFVLSHATLSLSAVVAFVLGIGMAADASIICFERIKEELERGTRRTDAVTNGFRESFSTIRDANLVTVLAMIALFVAGIGPIQGFSLTMLASIVTSIGTNFFLVRLLSKWLAGAESVPISLFIGRSRGFFAHILDRFDFIGFGKVAIILSSLTIASGAIYYRAHGLNLDIDFTAGTALDIDLEKAIDQDTATQIMTEAGIVPATVAIGGESNGHIAARFDEILKPADLNKIIEAFKTKYENKVVYEENTADPGVAQQFARRAVYALVAAFLSIFLFIGFRFSWPIAFATIVPIAHDTMLVSAIFALFKLEIDVTYIAALLTVIGYSLNDKIVIFGRIRENLAVGNVTSLKNLVNDSVRQTLGRSVYTVLTVVMASLCLYFFACEPLQMFALALVIGLISGAYSSIFMSTALWLSFKEKDKSKSHAHSVLSPSFVSHVFSLFFLTAVAWAVMAHVEKPSGQANHAPHSQSSASILVGGPLGDLTPYEAIAKDALKIVEGGDLKAAKARIKDLESSWDEVEEKLYDMSPESWTSIDKSIDRALAELRSGNPDATACSEALMSLLAKLNSMKGAK
ncbi:MAG: protein translocase subunit SecF [Pseudomonadota bacterium]